MDSPPASDSSLNKLRARAVGLWAIRDVRNGDPNNGAEVVLSMIRLETERLIVRRENPATGEDWKEEREISEHHYSYNFSSGIRERRRRTRVPTPPMMIAATHTMGT